MKRIRLILGLCFVMITGLVCFIAKAQNGITNEILPYKDINGYIIIRASVGGTEGDFLLDSRGRTALTEQAALVRGMKPGRAMADYPRVGYDVLGEATAIGFYIGKTIYAKNVSVRILKPNELLLKLKVDGVIGLGAFINETITINSKAKTITLSAPYKPNYVKLVNRADASLSANGDMFINLTINGKPIKAIADFYSNQPLVLSATDAKIVSGSVASLKLAGLSTPNVKVIKGNASYSVVGKSILSKGLITFDVARSKYYFQAFNQGEELIAPVIAKETIAIVPGKVNAIDRAYFLSNVYDYKNNKEWKTIGDKPVVIDFWATWCAPCLQMMPIMEELALKYKDQILFYKVNVDKEGELRQVFEANAIPLIIFGPLTGNPIREIGADTKEKIDKQLKELIKK